MYLRLRRPSLARHVAGEGEEQSGNPGAPSEDMSRWVVGRTLEQVRGWRPGQAMRPHACFHKQTQGSPPPLHLLHVHATSCLGALGS